MSTSVKSDDPRVTPKRGRRRVALAVLTMLFGVPGGGLALITVGVATAQTAPADRNRDGSTIESNFQKDPNLSPKQKSLLRRLQRSSEEPLRAEGWEAGKTVARLKLAVPSGLEQGASLQAHARRFLSANGALWNISSSTRLGVKGTVVAGDCSQVTFQLVHPSGLPVFNSAVTVIVTPRGIVRGVAGHLTGDKLPVLRGAPEAGHAPG